jgi:hypothetical protein
MRSRPARLTLSALAWIALGAAAFFTYTTQQQITHRHAALRAFENAARDASDALDGVQTAQQSYVAAGQDPRDWAPKVATYLQTASGIVDTMRTTAQSAAAGPALLDATTALTQLGHIDARIRERLDTEDAAAAAETVFTEASDGVASALSNLDVALGAEQIAADTFETHQQRTEMYALGGAAGFAALVLLLLGLASPRLRAADGSDLAADADDQVEGSLTLRPDASLADSTLHAAPAPAPADTSMPNPAELLHAAAELCAGFGAVRSADDLKGLLERASGVLNARGIIVWLGDTTGADLRPVLAHGYSDATLARIPTVARSADNAAASAYRTGELQVVRSRPGASQGALVAPLVGPDGCIGALTAEIRDRGEESDATRALARIVAAQLAGVLASAAASADAATPTPAAESHAAAG